jgi:hypothetical protein
MANVKPVSANGRRGRARTWWQTLRKGLAPPTYVYSRQPRRYPHTSVAEALRGDWLNVGHDMKVAAHGLYDKRQQR